MPAEKDLGRSSVSPLLAEGFRNVDSQSRDEQVRCVQCLQFIKGNHGFLNVRDAAFARLAPGSADRVYMERALQHIPRQDFSEVLRQYHSVLKSGGLFVSVEPNWELFTVRSEDVIFFRNLHHHWVDRFNHGNVAMNVPVGMRQAGFVDVTSEVHAVEFNRFEDGELV